jgi:acylphosphatase
VSRNRAHVFVSGRVQGVWFRESTRRRADELGVRGWVRNLPDGRVEALFEGDPSAVRLAVEYVREGPAHARVDQVDQVDEVDEVDDVEEPGRWGEADLADPFQVR